MDNEDIFQLIDIENIENEQCKQQLIKLKNEINTDLFQLKDKIPFQNISKKLSSIISIIISITTKKIEKIKQLYESLLKRDEQTIRILYRNLLTQKLLKDALTSKISILITKEKEYEMIKDKTGAYVKNGQIIYNKQKDNEIIILRQENSNLKDMIENYEKIIKEKDLLYENLINKFNTIKKNLNRKINHKKISVPNININLGDSNNTFINDENIYTCPINKDKSDKLLLKNNHINKDFSNFNYIKYKIISKKNNIPLNNSLTSRNYLEKSADNINQKENYLKRLYNSKIKGKSKLYINSDRKNDLSALKKMHLKINETVHLKKNKINLLQVYTSGSSNNINKFNVSKKLSNYFKEDLSSFRNKNNSSQKNSSSSNNKNIINKKKINKNMSEFENLHKSYLSRIPFSNYKKNGKIIKEINKTKRENDDKKISDEHYNSKNRNKKYININTKKIFLQNSFKKSEFT